MSLRRGGLDGLTLDSMGYFSGGGGVVFDGSYITTAGDATGGATITYSAVSLGATDANRVVVVAVACRNITASETISSVTIDGVTATVVAGSFQNSANGMASAIFYATGVTHTSGDIVINWSSTMQTSAIGVYRIVTATVTPSSGDGASGAGVGLSKAVTVPASGYGIGIYGVRDASGTVAWTNATRDFQSTSGGRSYSSAHLTVSATVSAAPAGDTGDALSVATWGP